MASPAAIPSQLHRPSFPPPDELNSTGRHDDFQFKQSRPPGLAIAQPQFFTVPPGMSPAGLLDSPGLFSPGQVIPSVFTCFVALVRFINILVLVL